jgi:exopolysaccharide production protein ExoZ
LTGQLIRTAKPAGGFIRPAPQQAAAKVRIAGVASKSSATLQGIQLLRAVAAAAVMTFHVSFDITHNVLPRASVPDFGEGAAGVDLFFVISGFVMVYSSERFFGKRKASLTFLLRRIVRIVPLYWVMTSIMLVYVLARGFDASDASPTQTLASYFFIPYWRPSGVIDPLYGIGWTLNYEMFFYVVFAVALVARREIAVVSVGTFLIAFVSIVSLNGHFPLQIAYLANPRILEFVFGMGIAMLYRAGVRLSPAVSFILVGLAIAEAIWWDDLPRWMGWGVPASQIVAAFALADPPVPIPLIFERLGDASYALYLTHPAVISAARALSQKGYLAPAAAPWPYLVTCVAISVGASLLVHHLLEKPITVAFQRVLSNPTSLRERFFKRASAPMPAKPRQRATRHSNIFW